MPINPFRLEIIKRGTDNAAFDLSQAIRPSVRTCPHKYGTGVEAEQFQAVSVSLTTASLRGRMRTFVSIIVINLYRNAGQQAVSLTIFPIRSRFADSR